MRLIEGRTEQSYEVEELFLPLETERRLEALGLTCRTRVNILGKKKHGAMIINIRGTRFALGRALVEQIEVREVASDE